METDCIVDLLLANPACGRRNRAYPYGKEITNWVASLFKGKTTIDASAAALERFNSAMAQGSVSAQSELTKLNLLYRAATDLSKPYEERAEAVKNCKTYTPLTSAIWLRNRLWSGMLSVLMKPARRNYRGRRGESRPRTYYRGRKEVKTY